MFNTAIILAAGKSTRMLPLSNYVPKPLIQVDGKPLIDNVIEKLKAQDISNIYVTYGYKSELLIPHIKDKVSGLINTTDKENAWFLYNTIISEISGPVIVLPCDISFSLNFSSLYFDWIMNDGLSTIVPFQSNNLIEADYITSKENFITRIDREVKTDTMASGIQILTPVNLKSISKDCMNFYSIWKKLIERNELKVSSDYAFNFKSFDRMSQIT